MIRSLGLAKEQCIELLMLFSLFQLQNRHDALILMVDLKG